MIDEDLKKILKIIKNSKFMDEFQKKQMVKALTNPDRQWNEDDFLNKVPSEVGIILMEHFPYPIPRYLEALKLAREVKSRVGSLSPEKSKELNTLYKFGVMPSDIFPTNSIIFVEGYTERIVLPIWAKKMGKDLSELGISVIPIRGKGSGKYHLKVWTEVAKNVRIPYFMILDKDAEADARKLSETSPSDCRLFLLKKGSIEEYYHPSKLIQTIESEYGLKLNKNEKAKILKSPRDKNIKELLTSKDEDKTNWKIIVGKKVAESMQETEIDDEIKGIITKIVNY
jgi:predicted ATP-dependent endonuclease of OLD family